MPAMLGLAPLAAFLVAALVAGLLLLPAARRLALDAPNERSLHEHPVPRTGGIAIAAGVGAACLFGRGFPDSILLIAGGLAIVSFADDLMGLPAALRLILHLAAAAAAVAFDLQAPALVAILLAFAIAWATNAYNFMDGADGLAAGMAIFGFGAYAVAAHLAGAGPFSTLCAAIAAAAAAFLPFNWHPARLFMGDAGAVPLGFLAAALGVAGWGGGLWPLWFPALVFGPFLGDATLTLARRLGRRERVWQAHRDHYYQRLVRMGLGHQRTALLEYAAMAACALIALAALGQPAVVQALAVLWAVVALAGLAAWIDYRWKVRA
jgi:UDP-N-acetylmuramyl pentapeptide phosphotransferase/UDP-N-acetylglucosamine-1-phosphate transferase